MNNGQYRHAAIYRAPPGRSVEIWRDKQRRTAAAREAFEAWLQAWRDSGVWVSAADRASAQVAIRQDMGLMSAQMRLRGIR